MTTWQHMTLEHLGDNATEADLAAFRRACYLRTQTEDEDDSEATDWMWGQGDFLGRVRQYVDYDPDNPADPDAIRMGGFDL